MTALHTHGQRKQTMPQAEIRNYGFFATALGALLLFVATAAPALAVDADWLSNPGSGDWNTNGNWNPPTAPVNAGDTATFHISMITSLSLSGAVTINTMTFNSGANAFTIDTNGNSFSFVGTGIVNNSTQTQFIENGFGIVNFSNSSTAGNARINNDNGGVTNFLNSSTAGNATITNTNIGSGSGVTNFSNTSTAGNALIENDA